MATVTFDTLEFVETLEKAGINREHASGIASAVRDAQESVLSEYTKTAQKASNRAVTDLDSKTEKALLLLEHKIDKRFSETEAKIELVRKDMGAMEQRFNSRIETLQKDLTIKMGSMFMMAIGILIAAMRFMK